MTVNDRRNKVGQMPTLYSTVSTWQNLKKGSAWIKLKLKTKVYPGNVQGTLPRMILILGYLTGICVLLFTVIEEVDNVQKAYSTPIQTIKSEILDSFPVFDIQICPVPRIKLWDPSAKNSYTYRFFSHVDVNKTSFPHKFAVDPSTSIALILAGEQGVVAEIPAKLVESNVNSHGYSHRNNCAVWELSKYPRFFSRSSIEALILNVNITDGGSVSALDSEDQVDLVISPSLGGMAQKVGVLVRESDQVALSGSSLTVQHPR